VRGLWLCGCVCRESGGVGWGTVCVVQRAERGSHFEMRKVPGTSVWLCVCCWGCGLGDVFGCREEGVRSCSPAPLLICSLSRYQWLLRPRQPITKNDVADTNVKLLHNTNSHRC